MSASVPLHDTVGAEPITLRDGTQMVMRRIAPDDWVELIALVARLSPESRRFRFFTPKRHIPPAFARRLAIVDFVDRAAFVCHLPGETAIRAVGRYESERPGGPTAEVAFVVEDAYHGQGIGTHLLEHLEELARANGKTEFVASVLAENDDMLELFRHTHPRAEFHYERDIVTVRFPL